MEVPAAEIMAAGNSSLNLMHLVLSTALQLGLWGDERKWSDSQTVKVLTPVPGYDRHFVLCQHFGMEMVNIPMLEDGPDMQKAAELAAADSCIKAIWCVPKYANPTGNTYSDSTVRALADLPNRAAAEDFVVLWTTRMRCIICNNPEMPWPAFGMLQSLPVPKSILCSSLLPQKSPSPVPAWVLSPPAPPY